MDRRGGIETQGFRRSVDGYLHQIGQAFQAARAELVDHLSPGATDQSPAGDNVRSIRPAFRGEAALEGITCAARVAFDDAGHARTAALASSESLTGAPLTVVDQQGSHALARAEEARFTIPDRTTAIDEYFSKLEADLGVYHPAMPVATRDSLLGMTRRLSVSVGRLLEGAAVVHEATAGYAALAAENGLGALRPASAMKDLTTLGQRLSAHHAAAGPRRSTASTFTNTRTEVAALADLSAPQAPLR